MARQLSAYVSILALLLSGCYQVDKPFLKTGERVDVAGMHACHLMTGSSRILLREEASGLVLKDYRYIDTDGYNIAFKQLAPNFYIAQALSPKGEWFVLYVELDGAGKAILYGPDVYSPTRNPVADLAQQHAVTSKFSATQGFVLIQGEPKNVAAYFEGHPKGDLTKVGECARIGDG